MTKPADERVRITRESFKNFGDDPELARRQAANPLAAIRIDSAVFEGKTLNVTAQIVLRGSAAKVESIVAAIRTLMESKDDN